MLAHNMPWHQVASRVCDGGHGEAELTPEQVGGE